MAESASAAMSAVPETLAPAERAVFVLREVYRLSVRGHRRHIGGGRAPVCATCVSGAAIWFGDTLEAAITVDVVDDKV